MADKSSESLTSVEEIYQNWFNGAGNCNNCPRRDGDRVLTPHYGYGDVPADIALVAQAPGGENIHDVSGASIGDGKRTWQHYRDAGHSGAAKAGPDGFSISSIESVGNYEEDVRPFTEAFDRKVKEVANREARIYLTQHTKCQDIHDVDGFDPKTDNGQDQCARYLAPEMQAVEADVIVVTGGKPQNHLRRALRDLGVTDDLPSRVRSIVFDSYDDSPQVKSYESDLVDAEIIASYHWGFKAMGSMKQYCDIDSVEEYVNLLAEEAAKHVQYD